MRQNFRRDKMKKEELRKKKQEEKRNKRLAKKEKSASLDPTGPADLTGTVEPTSTEGIL